MIMVRLLLVSALLVGCSPSDAQLHACNARIDAAYIEAALELCDYQSLDECEANGLTELREQTMQERDGC